ncbi:MAG TPA: cyclic nucleotide-binding domain-containing protein [Planctomycetota bacterium]|nr:cyclic nucleotide-binding domain-containing protein [Planctomycetota bacterium]
MVDPELRIEVPMFQTLPLAERERLAGLMKEEILPGGRVLFEVGDPGTSMYIVVKGKIRISIAGDSGEEVQLAALGGGEFFGELALLDQNPRSARATAIEETTLYGLDRDNFLKFVGSRPDAALSMLSATAKRLRHTDELMRSRAAFDVNEEFKKHDTAGGRWAENLANAMGSWIFMFALTFFTVAWIGLALGFELKWLDSEDLPRIAFILGVVQTFSGPIIMMGQNRDQIRGKIQADADFKVNLKNEVAIEKALERLDEMRRTLPELRRQIKEHETVVKKQYENLKKQIAARPAAPAPFSPQVAGAIQPDEEIPGEGTAVFVRPFGAGTGKPVGHPTPDPDEAEEESVGEATDNRPLEAVAAAGEPVAPKGDDTVKTALAEALKKFKAASK